MMKKLHELKSWLTLEDTAKRLSVMLGDDVTVADIFQLVLEGHLTLSVNFINPPYAKSCEIVPISKALEKEKQIAEMRRIREEEHEKTLSKEALEKLRAFKKQLADMCKNRPENYVSGLPINEDDDLLYVDNDSFFKLGRGIYDLAMLGAEKEDILHLYQSFIGEDIDIVCPVYVIDGSFIIDEYGNYYQLLQFFGTIETKDQNGKIKVTKHKPNIPESYCPAGGLPINDLNFVVRTSAINRFEQSLSEQPVEKPKYTHTSELMQIMDKAIVEFWENHDIKNPPKSEVIKQWIKENYGHLSDREITALDSIMRPLRYKLEKKR